MSSKKKLLFLIILTLIASILIIFFLKKKNLQFKSSSCLKNYTEDIPKKYNKKLFFISGHTYGKLQDNNLATHPKFLKEMETEGQNFKFGIFAGDVTRDGSDKAFKLLRNQIKNFDFKVYIAPGNHDIGSKFDSPKRKIYLKHFDNSYYSFVNDKNLFIILDPYINSWSIKNDQLKFLREIISSTHKKVDNVLIIVHAPIFLSKKYKILFKINSNAGKGKDLNYWSEVSNILKKYKNNYFLISGDVNASIDSVSYYCKKVNNVTYLATGIGKGKKDNYLVFGIKEKKIEVYIKFF